MMGRVQTSFHVPAVVPPVIFFLHAFHDVRVEGNAAKKVRRTRLGNASHVEVRETKQVRVRGVVVPAWILGAVKVLSGFLSDKFKTRIVISARF